MPAEFGVIQAERRCARPKYARWFHPMTRDILVMHIYNMSAWMYVRLSAVPESDPSCLLEYAYARDIHAALPQCNTEGFSSAVDNMVQLALMVISLC